MKAMLARPLRMPPHDGAESVVRRFAAPRGRVFDAWFDPHALRAWMFEPPWGGMLRVAIDARIGGRFSFVERRSGVDFVTCGEYLEIERPQRLVFTWSTPHHSSVIERITVTFAAVPEGCEMTLQRDVHATAEPHGEGGHAAPPSGSWSRTFTALAATLRQPAASLR